jgi:general secretion pathway protein A
MYERFYGLLELPFELTPNPRYLFLTARHRGALCNLQYGITARRGITLLIGEAGTGKTTLVHAALGLVQRDDVRCVYLNNPTLTRAEFVEFLAHGFGLSDEAKRSKAVFLRELERVLIARLAQGLVSALLVDEAQSLPHELLEETRLLANMETATDKLLPVVLAGQPELADRLNEPSLRQLKQRVALRCDLGPLQLHETASYIAARLVRAGGRSAEIFTREAVEAIHTRSRGIPRTISVICDNALIGGFAADRRPVDREIVFEVCRDLDFGRSTESPGTTHQEAAVQPPPLAHQVTVAVPVAEAGASPSARPGFKPVRDAGDVFTSFARRGRFPFFREDA